NITVQARELAGAPSSQNFTITVLPAMLQTTSFQDGVNGYNGTQDSILQQGSPDTVFGASQALDSDYAAAGGSQSLIRFDDIFGSTIDQIPSGAIIVSATLTLYTADGDNDDGDGGMLNRMLVNWDEDDTWNTMNGGVSADGVEAFGTFYGQIGNAARNSD